MQPLAITLAVIAALTADLVALMAAQRRMRLSSRAGILADGVVVLIMALAFPLAFGNFDGTAWVTLVVHAVPVELKGALTAFPLGYFAARLALGRLPAECRDAARLMGLTELDMLWRWVIPAEWPLLLTGATLSVLSALAIAVHQPRCGSVPAMVAGLAVGILLTTLLGLARASE